MNRPIKFRAWDDKNKEWLLGYELENLGGFSLFGECVLMGEWERVAYPFIFGRDGKRLEHLKVMQFTGLKDKNGTEIYEGDILKCPTDDYAHGNRSDVQFYKGEFHVTIGYDLTPVGLSSYKTLWETDRDNFQRKHASWLAGFEVIGNIYENEELLKQTA